MSAVRGATSPQRRPSGFAPVTTPSAPARRTPSTGPRAPTKPRPVTYSSAPLCTIDENSLVNSRFINPHKRRLAYRDTSGRVNVELCRRSLASIDSNVDSEADRSLLSSWARHAGRAIAARPAEESLTLDEMLAMEREEEDARASQAALPLSLRRPRRAASALVPMETPPPSSAARAAQTAMGMPLPVLRGPSANAEQLASPSRKLAPGAVTMQRRLFAMPQPGDAPSSEASMDDDADDAEPSADLLYLRSIVAEAKQRRPRRAPTPEAEWADEVYEVSALLKEKDGRFLIRWEGYGAEDDTWEPEENVAPALVSQFRQAKQRAEAHAGDDFLDGRTRRLWCAVCAVHRPSDCFSALQRRSTPGRRACLNHHYNKADEVLRTPDTGRASGTCGKRPRDAADMLALSSPPLPPPPPKRVFLPKTSRGLSSRAADLEVSRCRLHGFSSW